MYERFYGLRERPFDLAPNPRFLLLTANHREALGNLEYGIRSRKGVTVLIGDAGTGKTTLIRTAIARGEAERDTATSAWAYLRNPSLTRAEFLEFLVTRFGLSRAARESKTQLLDELEHALLNGLHGALIVDEAQSVPLELLEEIRLLANIESDSQQLLPIILVGQPELADRLNESALRQLKQRVSLRCTLAPLTCLETAAYIAARIRVAGGEPGRIFSREAVLAVHERSGGVPRTISVICDNALMTGYAEEQSVISRDVVHAVCRDFDFAGDASALPTGPAEARRPAAPQSPVPPPAAAPLSDQPHKSVKFTDTERARGWTLRRRSS
jgi:general secretion pathway protein A